MHGPQSSRQRSMTTQWFGHSTQYGEKKSIHTLNSLTAALQAGCMIFDVHTSDLRCPLRVCWSWVELIQKETHTHGTLPTCLKPAGVMEDRKVLACVLQPSVVHASKEEAAKEAGHAVTIVWSFCTAQYGKTRSVYTVLLPPCKQIFDVHTCVQCPCG